MPRKRIFLYLIITILTMFYCSAMTDAQQTIINVPSSEVLPAGDFILKSSNRIMPFSSDQHGSITPTVTFGSGFGTEVSCGAVTSFDGQTIVRGDFAAKKVFFIGSSTRLTAGARINPYFTESSAPDTFAYSHLSHRISKTKTSLTAGFYVSNRKHYLPIKSGVLLGVEQVVIPNKLRLALDWISRDDFNHSFAVGIKYRPVPTVSITTAVLIPNQNDDNISFNISISKFISLKNKLAKQKGLL